jgi:drug/metabolite transporter (DMT)-like permease
MNQIAHPVMGPLEWLLLIILSILWGGSFFFVGVIVGALPPLTIVALRVGLAALTLHIVVLAMGQRMPSDRRIWTSFIGMGILNNLMPFCLIAWGQTHIASGPASILNANTPMFGVIVAHLLTADEKMNGSRFAGVVIGFSGVVIMVGTQALHGLGTDILAQLAILGAALSYAFAGVYGRRFRQLGVTPLQTATGQVSASTLLLLPIALMIDQPWTLPVPGIGVWSAVAGLALLSTALAYILYFRILATAGATNLLLVTLLIPLSAIVLGAAVLGEQLAVRHFVGMALIGLGLMALDQRPLRWLRSVLVGDSSIKASKNFNNL